MSTGTQAHQWLSRVKLNRTGRGLRSVRRDHVSVDQGASSGSAARAARSRWRDDSCPNGALDLPETDDDHRRVLAAIKFLDAHRTG